MKNLTECQDLVYKWNQNTYFQESYRLQEQMYLPEICDLILKEDKQFENSLDIGPGHGSLSLWLKINELTKKHTMMDIVPVDFWICYDFVMNYRMQYIHMDVFDLTVSNKFDLITSTQNFPHFKYRPDLAVKNIYEALTDDGIFVSCVLNMDYKDYRKSIECDYYGDWENIQKYKTALPSPSSVVCMYGKDDFERLLRTSFDNCEVFVSENGVEINAVCKK